MGSTFPTPRKSWAHIRPHVHVLKDHLASLCDLFFFNLNVLFFVCVMLELLEFWLQTYGFWLQILPIFSTSKGPAPNPGTLTGPRGARFGGDDRRHVRLRPKGNDVGNESSDAANASSARPPVP